MCPVDIIINGAVVNSLGPSPETTTVGKGVSVAWGGDEFRGYGVTENGQHVGSGQLATDMPAEMTIQSRFVAPIEKGQPMTLMSDTLILRFRK